MLQKTVVCVTVPLMTISWDPKKAKSNERKHGVTFTEASSALDDEFAIVRADRDYPGRSVLTGYSNEQHLLVVIHIEYIEHDWVRIISARKASRTERKKYEQGDSDE